MKHELVMRRRFLLLCAGCLFWVGCQQHLPPVEGLAPGDTDRADPRSPSSLPVNLVDDWSVAGQASGSIEGQRADASPTSDESRPPAAGPIVVSGEMGLSEEGADGSAMEFFFPLELQETSWLEERQQPNSTRSIGSRSFMIFSFVTCAQFQLPHM